MSQTYSHHRPQNSKILTNTLSNLTSLKGVCCRKSVLVERDIPLDIDAGFLTVTDTNAVDKESYECAP
jgi:hypothetical protein